MDTSTVSPEAAVRATYEVISLDVPLNELLAGIFLFLHAAANQGRLDISEEMNRAERRYDDGRAFKPAEFRGLTHFVRGEM